jgi:hypothetical protein
MISVMDRTFASLHDLCRYAAAAMMESADRTSDPRLRRELHRLGQQHAGSAHDLAEVLREALPHERRTTQRATVRRRRGRCELALAFRVQQSLIEAYEDAIGARPDEDVRPLLDAQYRTAVAGYGRLQALVATAPRAMASAGNGRFVIPTQEAQSCFDGR